MIENEKDCVGLQKLGELELDNLLRAAILTRQEISARLSLAARNSRTTILEEHRVAKRIEYDIGQRLAELRLADVLETGSEKSISVMRKKVARLRSRLEHSDWLLWTRSIWKFKDMESDAKKGEHPAQFSARVPQRLIQMFSFYGDTVLDPFVGSGTTCVEAIRLNRSCIGLDVNDGFLEVARRRAAEYKAAPSVKSQSDTVCRLENCDARDMKLISDGAIQLIIAHPPYWNCVKISDLENDLSNCDNDSYPKFLNDMKVVLAECLRVLENDRVAAFMVGDITRKVGGITKLFPFHSDLISIAQELGFLVWDIYIVETKMRNSGGMPMMGSYPYPHKIFAQFAHNYVVVLRKPGATENLPSS